MTRPSFEDIFMRLAWSLSERATCLRLKVGSVITTTDFQQVLSIGYNGNASGLPNTCDSTEPGNCGDLHAEENAVIKCIAPRNLEKYLFTSVLPCKMCAKRIINLGGITRVYFDNDYRLREGYDILVSSGIEVIQHHI